MRSEKETSAYLRSISLRNQRSYKSTQSLAEEETKDTEDGRNQKGISFHELFLFADLNDILPMIIGTVAAVGNGLSMPLMKSLCIWAFPRVWHHSCVGKFIQLISAFIGGLLVAFIQGWHLTIVMISIIPLLILSSGIMSLVIARMASRSQKAYSEAAATVERTIGSITTVAAFTGEKQVNDRYNRSLKIVCKASVQEGLAAGLGLGSAYSIIFCGYALGVLYG